MPLPLPVPESAIPVLAERTLRRVEVSGEGCWLWPGYVSRKGYGMLRMTMSDGERRWFQVHRVAYTACVGPIPEGLTLDHLCRVRRCCNPDHLEPVTFTANTLRGSGPTAVNARKTHCIRGHLFGPPGPEGANNRRRCLKCKRIWREARRAA
jgi:hypothetical protein